MVDRVALFEGFAAVPRPSRDTIAPPHDCQECAAIRQDFALFAHDLVPSEVLERRFDSLPLLSIGAWHYFLPAYISFASANPNSQLVTMLVINLDSESACSSDSGSMQMNCLSQPQRAAIAASLALLRRELDDPQDVQHRLLVSQRYRSE